MLFEEALNVSDRQPVPVLAVQSREDILNHGGSDHGTVKIPD